MRSGKDVFWMTLIAPSSASSASICWPCHGAAAAQRRHRHADVRAHRMAGCNDRVVSTVKLNNLNLYSSSLGFSTLSMPCA